MPLVRAGALPVSAVNVGLAASVPGLGAKVTTLQASLTGLQLALAGQVEVGIEGPPNPLGLAADLAASANPLEVAASINPLVLGADVDAAADLTVDLALVSAQLEIAEGVSGTLNLGLSAGGIAGYSYSGPGPGFGSELKRSTAAGIGKTPPTAQIQAVVIATESLDGWQAFSKSVNTGRSGAAPATGAKLLAYLGELPAAKWNGGVAEVGAEIDLLVADLRGQRSGIEGSLSLLSGVGLPEVSVLVDTGASIVADVGIDGLIENMVSVDADLTGGITGVKGEIDAVLALSADIAAQLSAGGLMFWSYTGPAAGLGEALAVELASGIPGSGATAPIYGLVLAGSPEAMGIFGSIFRTS